MRVFNLVPLSSHARYTVFIGILTLAPLTLPADSIVPHVCVYVYVYVCMCVCVCVYVCMCE